MADPTALIALASTGVAASGIASAAVLRGWQGWLDYKRLELAGRSGPTSRPAELAALRDRVRRLEAIASGTEG